MIDAAIVGVVAVAAWEGSKYVNNTIEKNRTKNKDKEVRGEHHTNVRESNREKDENGRARKQREQRLADERKEEAKRKSKNRKNR